MQVPGALAFSVPGVSALQPTAARLIAIGHRHGVKAGALATPDGAGGVQIIFTNRGPGYDPFNPPEEQPAPPPAPASAATTEKKPAPAESAKPVAKPAPKPPVPTSPATLLPDLKCKTQFDPRVGKRVPLEGDEEGEDLL